MGIIFSQILCENVKYRSFWECFVITNFLKRLWHKKSFLWTFVNMHSEPAKGCPWSIEPLCYRDTKMPALPFFWRLSLTSNIRTQVDSMVTKRLGKICSFLEKWPKQFPSQKMPKCLQSRINGTAHFKKCKQLFEYQDLLLFRDIWWSKF